jgi:PPOX class probable F420-dependent enzyme
MALDPAALPPEVLTFLTERHLGTLTTLRPDGSPHVVAVAFTWDDEAGLARVITSRQSRKARNVAAGGTRAVVAQVDGARWLALEGPARLVTDVDGVLEGERRYGVRYRQPQANPERSVIEIRVDRVLGRG